MSRKPTTPHLARRAAAVAGAILGLTLPASAHAQTITALNASIATAQQQASSLGASIQQKTTELAAARQQAAAAAARQAQLESVLAQGEQRAAELATRVNETRDQLVAARKRLHRALRALAGRLVGIYESNPPDTAEILLRSHGFDDLASRATLLGRIENADNALAARVHQLRDEVAVQLQAVQDARGQQLAYNRRVATARDQIAAVRAHAESQAAALDQARAQETAALTSLRSQVSGWEAQVQQLQAAQQQAVDAGAAQQQVASWFGNWAIPQAVVMCESGGNFHAVNPSSGAGGAYQILPSTWRLYGGQGAPQDASPSAQSQIASQIWANSGPSAWACAQ